MTLPVWPAPSEVVGMVRKKGVEEEEGPAWLEARGRRGHGKRHNTTSTRAR
jgi:hypothetical protein